MDIDHGHLRIGEYTISFPSKFYVRLVVLEHCVKVELAQIKVVDVILGTLLASGRRMMRL